MSEEIIGFEEYFECCTGYDTVGYFKKMYRTGCSAERINKKINKLLEDYNTNIWSCRKEKNECDGFMDVSESFNIYNYI